MMEPWSGVALFAASVACARARHACSCGAVKMENPKGYSLSMPCTVSSPGKVLLAGGYLVLEPENIGIPIAASARFYASVSLREWYDAAVFSTLVKDLCSVGTLIIKLQADNDFYSHIKELKRANKPLLSSSLRSIARLTPCHRDEITGEVEVSKTGMGSSAALTTSLVGALLHALGVVDVGATSFHYARTVVHNLSQLAHCIAQGKIGSGFDVSAAVYGSQIYCRFDPSKFDLDKVVASGNNLFAAVTDSSRWTQTAEPFSLPRGFGLIMADVCGGSSSSSMARGVLAWKAKKSEEVDRIWTGLAAANVAIKDSTMALHYLSHTHENAYNTVIDYACARKIEVSSGSSINPPPDLGKIVGTASREAANEIWAALLDLKTKFGVARVLLREMGVRSGQDIEPLQQQELADATEALPGVLCAGVPGAGGVDAMYAIVLCRQSNMARDGVESLWSTWNKDNADRPDVCALTLDAESDKSGVVLEEYSALYY